MSLSVLLAVCGSCCYVFVLLFLVINLYVLLMFPTSSHRFRPCQLCRLLTFLLTIFNSQFISNRSFKRCASILFSLVFFRIYKRVILLSCIKLTRETNLPYLSIFEPSNTVILSISPMLWMNMTGYVLTMKIFIELQRKTVLLHHLVRRYIVFIILRMLYISKI